MQTKVIHNLCALSDAVLIDRGCLNIGRLIIDGPALVAPKVRIRGEEKAKVIVGQGSGTREG